MKISTIYDAIVSKCNALFPNKQRLHNPYELTDNPELIMNDAWGLKVLTSSYVENEFCNLTNSREFSLILTRGFATVGSKGDAFDVVTKLLLEDQNTLINNFYSTSELGIPSTIDQIEITFISGLDFMINNQKSLLYCEMIIKITMSESLI